MSIYDETVKGISPAFESSVNEARKRLDSLIKPAGSLGKLEDIAAKLAGITGTVHNKINRKCVVVMSSDNGVLEEGVSSSPQAITAMQTVNIVKGLSGVGILAKHAASDIRVVDIGINDDLVYPGLINKKIRKGTSNMAKGPAMSREEAVRAVETGIEIVRELAEEGYNLLGTGEMGIGNTSTSSAILMTYTGCSADEAVGKGAGLTEEDFANKKRVISKAISMNRPDLKDPLDVLSKLGGFDIGGLAGCFLGAASLRLPIVIDGFISAAAALIAYKINPLVKDYMIPSHCSDEPGYRLTMNEIGLEPMLNLDMRLGEGSGCPLAFNIIEAAVEIINKMATFDEVSMENDFIIDIR
jgi:nicotinate-nucleotide--dimethylbenzimidazole phosphoribosyltransferase